MPGPLQVIAVSFGPGADFRGRVLAEVDRLQGRGMLRLLDMLFVAKDEDGTIQQLVVGDDEDFGTLRAVVGPLDGADLAERSVGDGLSGFDPADAWALAESLHPGTALAFLLIEHGWAHPLFDGIAEPGAARAAEANATRLASAAETRGAEAIGASEAIRAAAAADAVRALISAGIVEEAAAHEAVEAVRAAGLIVAAADEAAGKAVVEDAGEVKVAHDAAADAVAEAAATVRAASISPAEAMVLRYLPTQSSFAVIADKLGISRSAAKERAERAYKKLGIHSRAEAVSRARALGIID